MRIIGLSGTDTLRLVDTERQQLTEPNASASEVNDQTSVKMAPPRRKLLRCIKAMIGVSMLATVFVFVRIHFFKEDRGFSFTFFQTKSHYKIEDVVRLKLTDNTVSFADSLSGLFLKIKLSGDKLKLPPDLDSCEKILGHADPMHSKKLKLGLNPFVKTLCMKWKDTVLVINDTRSKPSRCFSVHWSTSASSSPENCISLSGAHWYGGSLLHDQQWPLEDVSIQTQPFISSPLSVFQNFKSKSGSYGPVLERMWLSSGGFGVVADSMEPLYVSVNAHKQSQLCLKTQYANSTYLRLNNESLTLKYAVCVDKNAKRVHEHIMQEFVTLPVSAPNEALMKDPILSTRGINMDNLTQPQALRLHNSINKNVFPLSQLHFAGNFTRIVGDVYFDFVRFPNAHQMIGGMKTDRINVSTSMLPVLQKDGQDFKTGVESGIFVNDSRSQIQYLTWDNRIVALIDFTNQRASTWMAKRLKDFKLEAPVRAFHFDSGEATLLSQSSRTSVPLANPCLFSMHYAQFASSLDDLSVIGVGYRSQEFPLLVDIGARSSSWGHYLGLKSIIPSVLTAGLLGYPFVMVGPVGGVPVHKFDSKKNQFALPDEELYIRWLQLSVFLPAFELSVLPGQYHDKVTGVAERLLKLRADRVFPVIQTAVKEFLHTGAPIIRPLWWMATDDGIAQSIDCEFLVSNKILVAPVLQAGMRRRDIYLPKVKDLKWQDDLHGVVYSGGQWLRGYKVNLLEVATFRPVFKSETVYHLHH